MAGTTFDVEKSIAMSQAMVSKGPGAITEVQHPNDVPIDFVNLAKQFKTNEQKILEANLQTLAILERIELLMKEALSASTPIVSAEAPAKQKMFAGKPRR